MRPAGEVRQALLAAARQGPGTLRQLAQRAQVGWDAARDTVPNMARSGVLKVVGEERVEYRNRLVHVYEAAEPAPVADGAPVQAGGDLEHRSGHGWVDLNRCMGGWAR